MEPEMLGIVEIGLNFSRIKNFGDFQWISKPKIIRKRKLEQKKAIKLLEYNPNSVIYLMSRKAATLNEAEKLTDRRR